MPDSRRRSILLVNPWIHDFSAYDFWTKPLGLLYLGALLRARGFGVSLLDCVDFHSLPDRCTKAWPAPEGRDFGRGHFFKETIPKPPALRNVPRRFRRYGLPPGAVEKYLAGLPRPGLILVTSLMTYWYPGVAETIGFLKNTFPGVPIFLGGVYATLCTDHARRHSGADRVLPGPWDDEKERIVFETLECPGATGVAGFSRWPYPAFDLYPRLGYVCLLTRSGCPYRCPYCAASRLVGRMETRRPESVVGEIEHWQRKFRIRNFAFYDDALLADSPAQIKPILREIIRRDFRCFFHTPNAVHARMVDEETAALLFQANFRTIRLGLETADPHRQAETGGKVDNPSFRRAVENLKRAGYRGRDIGVYLLAGLPGQTAEELKMSAEFVLETGARPILNEYSPVPGTDLFPLAQKASPLDIENEPLFQNNSLLPCLWEKLTLEDFREIKQRISAAFSG